MPVSLSKRLIARTILQNGKAVFIVKLLLLACSWLVGLSAQGEIYRWTDQEGQLHFSDKVPDKTPEEQVVESIGEQLMMNSYQGSEVTTADFLGQRNALRREKAFLQGSPVVIYSAAWCGVCKRARQFFKTNNIAYSEYDVETSTKGKNDFARLQGRGVPIILMNGKRMNGFDEGRFKQLYRW